MNKVAFKIVKILLSLLVLTNFISIIILFNKINLALFTDDHLIAIVIITTLLTLLEILGILFISMFCSLSRKRWAIILGTTLFFSAAVLAGWSALVWSFAGFYQLVSTFLLVSITATLFTYLSALSLVHDDPLKVNDTKHVLKKFVWLPVTAILIFVGIWLQDEKLDPEFERFFIENRRNIPDVDNIAAGIAGLDAPLDSNFINFGVLVLKNSPWTTNPDKPDKIKTTPETKNKIEFIGSNEELNCWLYKPEPGQVIPNCATEKRLKELLGANATLLARYQQVTQMPHLQGFIESGNIFLSINRLIAADIELKLRHGHYEDAYQEWLDNYRFLTRMKNEETEWRAKAMLLAAHGLSLESAALLIRTYKNIGKVHGEALIIILQPAGLAGWNLPGVMREQYAFFHTPLAKLYEPQFWFNPNFVRNRILYSAQAFLKAADAPPISVKNMTLAAMNEYGGLKGWDIDYLRDPLNTVLVRGLVLGTGAIVRHREVELVQNMQLNDGKHRALILALLIKQRGLRDNEIADFISKSPPELKNPFTTTAMQWDAKTREIQFDNPDTGSIVKVRL